MSDADNDRKRKAGEMDAAAVAPKKKLAAQAALAAAEAAGKDSPRAAKAGGGIKLEPGAKASSYSVEETAPSGANAADSEEVLKFQNQRMYAALEAKKHEITRLEVALSKHEATDKLQRETLGCITRHWCGLTEELKSTLQRLEHSPAAMDTSQATKLLETLSTLKDLVPAEVDTTMAKSFHVAQVLMQEIVQSVTDHDVQLKSVLTKLEAAAGDAAIREEVAKAKKQLDTMAKDLDRMQDTHREYVVVEGSKADLVRAQAALVTDLQGKVADLTGQLEQAERRLVLSEGAVRAAREAGPAADTPTAAGGSSADAGGDAQQRNLEYKHQADSRLEEIKTLQKTIIQLTEQNGAAAAYAPQEVSENMILQSPAYVALSEQLKAAEKECKTYHMAKITHLNVELAQEREKQQRERREVEMQHQHKIKQVLLESQRKSNEVMEAKQEIKSLQFKLEQKSVGEISTKRAQELEETLQKAQAECARLRKEHDALRARPDAEELRREFREEKEKLWKERDTELNKANDLAEQVKERDKRIEALVAAAKGGEGANGVNGPDAAHRKEVEGLEAEVKGLRTDKKELTRRFQKAERGFNECNKLYQQHKKDKEETMKDLESLGLSFEEMQEQNTRLLQTMKQKDEEHNELLRQRIKERQEREMIADEKNALKLKLDKTEEVLKARQDAIDKLKRDLENLQQEQAKKMKEDECSAAIVAEHRKMLLFREAQGKESRREAEKARNALAELQKAKQEAERDLHEARFEKTRVEETLESTQRRLERLERQGGSGAGAGAMDTSRENLLKHYRSCVKCHCNDGDKERVLPCGHASCKKCIEKLIAGRSRKCPQCSTRFDQNDVKPLHLQSSFGDHA